MERAVQVIVKIGVNGLCSEVCPYISWNPMTSIASCVIFGELGNKPVRSDKCYANTLIDAETHLHNEIEQIRAELKASEIKYKTLCAQLYSPGYQLTDKEKAWAEKVIAEYEGSVAHENEKLRAELDKYKNAKSVSVFRNGRLIQTIDIGPDEQIVLGG